MTSHGQANEPQRNRGESDALELSAERIRAIQALVDRARHAAERGEFRQSETFAVEALQAVGLYSNDTQPRYRPPGEGVTQALPPAVHPLIGQALALEALRTLGRGEREVAYLLASDGAQLAPASLDVLMALRTVVRDNVARGLGEDSSAFLQLDRVAAVGIRFLEKRYGISDGCAPMDLIAAREEERFGALGQIEGIVRDHLAAAERVSWHPEVRRALCLRGAETGLSGLPLVGLPQKMQVLTELYRHDDQTIQGLDSGAKSSTGSLLEAVGAAFRGAGNVQAAFVAFSLAARLKPEERSLSEGLEALRLALRGSVNGGDAVSELNDKGIATWNAYRVREIPLGWNFGTRGNELFAEVFYRVRGLEGFSLEFAREVAHDYAIVDRGGTEAAQTYVNAVPQMMANLRRSDVEPAVVFKEGLRAQALLRYIESRGDIPREVLKPAHRFADELEELVRRATPSLPADAFHWGEAFFRVIRTQHSA